MGLLKKKQTVKIERLGKTAAIIKIDGILKSSEVCDLLISALCKVLKTISDGNEEQLECYKRATIKLIEEIK